MPWDWDKTEAQVAEHDARVAQQAAGDPASSDRSLFPAARTAGWAGRLTRHVLSQRRSAVVGAKRPLEDEAHEMMPSYTRRVPSVETVQTIDASGATRVRVRALPHLTTEISEILLHMVRTNDYSAAGSDGVVGPKTTSTIQVLNGMAVGLDKDGPALRRYARGRLGALSESETIRNVEYNSMALEYAPEALRGKESVVLAAVKQSGDSIARDGHDDGAALQYASKALRGKESVVLAAVEQYGMALKYASKALRRTESVVLAAVKQDSDAVLCASEALLGKESVVLAAVEQDGMLLEWASEALRGQKSVVLAAVKQDGRALAFVDNDRGEESLLVDPDVVAAAAKWHQAEQKRTPKAKKSPRSKILPWCCKAVDKPRYWCIGCKDFGPGGEKKSDGWMDLSKPNKHALFKHWREHEHDETSPKCNRTAHYFKPDTDEYKRGFVKHRPDCEGECGYPNPPK